MINMTHTEACLWLSPNKFLFMDHRALGLRKSRVIGAPTLLFNGHREITI